MRLYVILYVLVAFVPIILIAFFPAQALLLKIIFVVVVFSMPFAIRKMISKMGKKLLEIKEEEAKISREN